MGDVGDVCVCVFTYLTCSSSPSRESRWVFKQPPPLPLQTASADTLHHPLPLNEYFMAFCVCVCFYSRTHLYKIMRVTIIILLFCSFLVLSSRFVLKCNFSAAFSFSNSTLKHVIVKENSWQGMFFFLLLPFLSYLRSCWYCKTPFRLHIPQKTDVGFNFVYFSQVVCFSFFLRNVEQGIFFSQLLTYLLVIMQSSCHHEPIRDTL